ncbi:MAG: maleylpyruvate isomerase N-terminal domain-containing protein, partial [Pseudonocardiaceae bacterium]
MLDLGPAARQMASLLDGVTDEQLTAPTPCDEYTLGDLIDHVSGLSQAFTAAAAKDLGPRSCDRSVCRAGSGRTGLTDAQSGCRARLSDWSGCGLGAAGSAELCGAHSAAGQVDREGDRGDVAADRCAGCQRCHDPA